MTATKPSVSIVVVNYNGLRHLDACFRSLHRQTYPDELIEILLVDNGSSDGSVEFVAEHFPTVKILRNPENRGFALGVNYGARHATGDYLALINNDAYADPRWLDVLVSTILDHREQGVVCAGAKMLDWHGKRIDFVGGGVNAYGMGNQFFHTLPVEAITIEAQELLFACGGAMLVDRAIFLQIGGFDEDFFAYFEDVDFGWRLWLYGYRVLLAPDAVVYHRQHATSSAMHNYQLNTLFERNALVMIIKNYDEASLHRVLNLALFLTVARSLSEAGSAIDRREFNLGYRRGEPDFAQTVTVPKIALSHLVAIKDVLESFPHIWQKRQKIQAERALSDHDLMRLFRFAMGASYHTGPYLHLQQILSDRLGIRDVFAGERMHRVLILSGDPLYEKLAGPGIRAVEMARYLAQSCQVILVAPDQANVTIPGVTTVALPRDNQQALQHLVTEVEVVIIQGYALRRYPFLQALHRIMVIDLYDPFHLENLQSHSRYPGDEAHVRTDFDRQVINELLEAGDYFICASERQRDFWMGSLSSQGRLSPTVYQEDPTFASLISVVPFGIDPIPPAQTRPVLKGVIPGIASGDTVVIWGGGIWEWLDPLVVIRAMAGVREQRSDVKLFFMGYQHPNPEDVPLMPKYEQAVALATELGLLNQSVFFNDTWVPYAERANYFLEADIGVSAHLAHIETHYAFRTRLLDYIWAGLPMVVTAGDTLADAVAERGLGITVKIGDEQAFTRALLELAGQHDAKQSRAAAFQVAQHEYAWPEALKPLLEFCRHPRYAPRVSPLTIGNQVPPHAEPIMLSTQQRTHELEVAIAQKDAHIAYLENLIQRVQSGRVMQLLRLVGRLRVKG